MLMSGALRLHRSEERRCMQGAAGCCCWLLGQKIRHERIMSKIPVDGQTEDVVVLTRLRYDFLLHVEDRGFRT